MLLEEGKKERTQPLKKTNCKRIEQVYKKNSEVVVAT